MPGTGEPYPPQTMHWSLNMDGREAMITNLMTIDMEPLVSFAPEWQAFRSGMSPVMLCFTNYGENNIGRPIVDWKKWGLKQDEIKAKKIEASRSDFRDWAKRNILGVT